MNRAGLLKAAFLGYLFISTIFCVAFSSGWFQSLQTLKCFWEKKELRGISPTLGSAKKTSEEERDRPSAPSTAARCALLGAPSLTPTNLVWLYGRELVFCA